MYATSVLPFLSPLTVEQREWIWITLTLIRTLCSYSVHYFFEIAHSLKNEKKPTY